MQLRARAAEPETLRIHREMYEQRLKDMGCNGVEDDRSDLDAANDSVVLEHHDEASTKTKSLKED